MGFRASSEDTDMITRAIKDTELFFVKNVVGETYYSLMLNATQGTDYYTAVNGSGTMAGMKDAVGHLAFCALLRDTLHTTRMGSVRKRDDYSNPAGEDDIYTLCRYHYTIGRQYIDEVCNFLAITPDWSNNYFYEF